MPMLPIDQQITFLYTRDLASTVHFYEDVLGLELVLDQAVCRIYHVTGSAFVGLCQRDDLPDDRVSGVIFTLVTQQVDKWYTHLVKLGVTIEKPPTLNPRYNIYHFFLRDPNGYLIEIQRFLNPAWNQ